MKAKGKLTFKSIYIYGIVLQTIRGVGWGCMKNTKSFTTHPEIYRLSMNLGPWDLYYARQRRRRVTNLAVLRIIFWIRHC